MATSGTTTFNLDIDDVIEEAYERCGIRNTKGYDLKSSRRSLNLLFPPNLESIQILKESYNILQVFIGLLKKGMNLQPTLHMNYLMLRRLCLGYLVALF